MGKKWCKRAQKRLYKRQITQRAVENMQKTQMWSTRSLNTWRNNIIRTVRGKKTKEITLKDLLFETPSYQVVPGSVHNQHLKIKRVQNGFEFKNGFEFSLLHIRSIFCETKFSGMTCFCMPSLSPINFFFSIFFGRHTLWFKTFKEFNLLIIQERFVHDQNVGIM